ncbi:basic leucine zipper transcriptional factor ATF-like 3 isoform X1 [Chrysemys picta bellii]|uniref:basic leucine zipper transcriptional factor ATF-like 3 isoform X1 n=1 Tax=Chrysemys picta bellii TaxID=8478 RepID=UPI0032B17F19
MSLGVPASGSVLQRSASSDGNQPQSPEEDDRKIRRREKNRVAAQRSRKKQTQKADKLHEAIQNCLLQPTEDVSYVEGSLDGVELLNHPHPFNLCRGHGWGKKLGVLVTAHTLAITGCQKGPFGPLLASTT